MKKKESANGIVGKRKIAQKKKKAMSEEVTERDEKRQRERETEQY